MKDKQSRKIMVVVAPVGKDLQGAANNPLTPKDVAIEVIDCTRAGAAMVHLHVRDEKGEQTEDLAVYADTLDRIRESSDIIIQGSTGGLTSLTLEERCVALNDPRTEVASLNMGSINFGEDVYINRMPDIRYWARCMAETRVLPELEIFAAGMLPAYMKLVEEKVLRRPYAINFCLGFHWALPATAETLFFMKSMLPEAEVPWGVIHDGMSDFTLLATAIGMGASMVRVGFEDSVHFAPGRAAAANVELVERVVSMIHDMGLETATCAEARQMLEIT